MVGRVVKIPKSIAHVDGISLLLLDGQEAGLLTSWATVAAGSPCATQMPNSEANPVTIRGCTLEGTYARTGMQSTLAGNARRVRAAWWPTRSPSIETPAARNSLASCCSAKLAGWLCGSVTAPACVARAGAYNE